MERSSSERSSCWIWSGFSRFGSAARERGGHGPRLVKYVRSLFRVTSAQRRRLLLLGSQREAKVYARVATFESDPANVDDAISMVRAEVEAGQTPEGLDGAKMLMLVNRDTGKGLGVTLFDSEEAMRRGDAALNAMDPGANEQRTSVEFYEVPVQTIGN